MYRNRSWPRILPPAASSGDGASVIYQAADSPVKGMSSAGGNASYYNVASAVKDSVVEITTEFRVESGETLCELNSFIPSIDGKMLTAEMEATDGTKSTIYVSLRAGGAEE